MDGGSKTFGYDGYFLESYGHVLEYPEAQLKSFSQEYGVITTRQTDHDHPQLRDGGHQPA